jgi:hypothetical protein
VQSVVMTVVWGVAYVVQAAISATIIEATSTDRAFVINKILPYLFLAALGAWTAFYGFAGQAARRRTCGLGVTNTHGDACQNRLAGIHEW